MVIYEKINDLMKNKNISSAQLARDIDISTSLLTQWKQGKQNPSIIKLKKLSEYFEVPLNYFVGEPPFDKWDYIKKNRSVFFDHKSIPEEFTNFIKENFGTFDDFPLSIFISYIDSYVRAIVIDENNNAKIILSPLAEAMCDIRKDKIVLNKNYVYINDYLQKYDLNKFVPVYKNIENLSPYLKNENITGYEYSLIKNYNDCFYLQLSEEMENYTHCLETVRDDSLLLIQKQEHAHDYQLVMCIIDNQTHIRRFHIINNLVILQSENYTLPILLTQDDFLTGKAVIIGVVSHIIDKLFGYQE
ncbi:MAG: helix-turn-helix domain-containing protein [Eubacteriales bacterium]